MGCQGFPSRHSNFGSADLLSVQSSMGATPRPSNFEENSNSTPGAQAMNSPRFGFYPAPNPEFSAPTTLSATTNKNLILTSSRRLKRWYRRRVNRSATIARSCTCSFVWSSSASPVSEGGGLHVFGGTEFGPAEQSGRSDLSPKEIRMLVADHPQNVGGKGNARRIIAADIPIAIKRK